MYIEKKERSKGFGAVGLITAIFVLTVLGIVGYIVIKQQNTTTTKSSTPTNQKTNSTVKATNPYADWKTATSDRAGFSIKYPASWELNTVVGKDNIEYVTLDTNNFSLTMSSYIGTDTGDGGQTATTCEDCQTTITTTSFDAGSTGMLNLQTVAFKLDAGSGKAMILRKTDGTYYIPSSSKPGVVTSFRGLSKLSSLEYYQQQTSDQFMKNPDYTTAQKILESLAY